MLATIWWAETASEPKRATKIAISVKLETSKKVLQADRNADVELLFHQRPPRAEDAFGVHRAVEASRFQMAR